MCGCRQTNHDLRRLRSHLNPGFTGQGLPALFFVWNQGNSFLRKCGHFSEGCTCGSLVPTLKGRSVSGFLFTPVCPHQDRKSPSWIKNTSYPSLWPQGSGQTRSSLWQCFVNSVNFSHGPNPTYKCFFINKLVLKHSRTDSFPFCPRSLLFYGRRAVARKITGPPKPDTLPSLAKKSLLWPLQCHKSSFCEWP